MDCIRWAEHKDLARIAEIEVFNYRLNFYPIFKNDEFYFHELQVPAVMKKYEQKLPHILVYDDGTVKGFIFVQQQEIKKLFVEPVLQGRGIGSRLLQYAAAQFGANRLWALEKNSRAIAFYKRHGFYPSGERRPEEGTEEYLILLKR